jgi:hypothetical protein
MRRMRMLLCIVALPAIVLIVGCTGGASREQAHHHKGHTAKELELRPEHGSGVSGNATFKDAKDAVVVELEVRDLPEPDMIYLAHIHPGTCAQEEEEGESHGEHHEQGEHAEEGEGHEHMEEGHEHGATEEIEYPLSPVDPNAKGEGTSTTVVHDVTLEGLLSGEPMHINVHRPGSGEPPPVTCANLNEAV